MRNAVRPAILSFLTAVLVYGICLRNDFVYDDVGVLQMDDRLANPSQWRRYWTESYNGGVDNLYRPAVSMSYAAQWAIHGLTPWPYFAINILLHASCAAAAAVLVTGMSAAAFGAGATNTGAAGVYAADSAAATDTSRAPPPHPMPPWTDHARMGAIAGLIFAVHPVHSEVVASVVGRCETMCTLPALLAMILMLRPVTVGRAVAIWALSTLSLLSKEQGMLLPLLLLLQGWLLGFQADRRAKLTLILLLAWTWAGYLFVRENVINLKFSWDRGFLDWTQQPLVRSHGLDRWLWPLAILGRYVQLLLFPWRLSLDYGFAYTAPQISRTDAFLLVGTLAAVSLSWVTTLAWRSRGRSGSGPDPTPPNVRGSTLVLFACLALLITYAPIANALTLIGTIMAERLIYLPSVFFIALIALALIRLNRIGTLIAALAIALSAVRTVTYVSRFDERLAFYQQSVAERPQSVKLRVLHIAELTNLGRLDEAAGAAKMLRELAPLYTEAWYQSAWIEMQRGDYDLADAYLFRLQEISPSAKAVGLAALIDQKRSAARATTMPSSPR